MNYRNKVCVKVIQIPIGFEEEDRLGCKAPCCPKYLVLASDTSTDSYKNDWIGHVVKRSDISDTVEFIIEKCNDPNYTMPLMLLGDVGIYPQDDLAFGFMFDMRQYLLTYGIGLYKIRVEFTISGVIGGYDLGEYDLRLYSIKSAKDTVRIYTEYGSKYQRLNIDFTNSNHRDTLRFNGFFGERKPSPVIKNLITKGRKVEKSTRLFENKYTLYTDPVSILITRKMFDMLLNENTLLVSDHNSRNHDYLLFDKSMYFIEMDDPEYMRGSRLAKVTITLGEGTIDDKAYFNKM